MRNATQDFGPWSGIGKGSTALFNKLSSQLTLFLQPIKLNAW